MKSSFLALFLTATACTNAYAQAIPLLCSGTWRFYDEDKVAQVPPSAGALDLQAETVSTPVGAFRITRVEPTTVYFDDPKAVLKVFGTLDRMSGAMNIFWRTKEQEAKLQAGLPTKMTMYADLRCTPSKRLF
jgi:hypothetical protein